MRIKLGFYQHYKGKVYQVIGKARHTESGEPLVIYHPVDADPNDDPWARPASMWFEEVEGLDGARRPRFIEI